MPCVERLFCAARCRRTGQSPGRRRCRKAAVVAAISLVFVVNLCGQLVFLHFLIRSVYAPALFAVYAYFFLVTAVAYFITAFSDPGSVDPGKVNMLRSCTVCERIKPLRAHHCSQCNRCWLRMDHHCPWVQNCIGANNYAQFFQLLVIVTVCLTVSLVNFIIAMSQPQPGHLVFQYTSMGIAGLITLVFYVVIIQLLALHVKLITSNQTTIEFYENKAYRKIDPNYKNPYDEGARANFRQIFPRPALMLLPVRLRSAIPCDGGYYTVDMTTGRDFRVHSESSSSEMELGESDFNFAHGGTGAAAAWQEATDPQTVPYSGDEVRSENGTVLVSTNVHSEFIMDSAAVQSRMDPPAQDNPSDVETGASNREEGGPRPHNGLRRRNRVRLPRADQRQNDISLGPSDDLADCVQTV